MKVEHFQNKKDWIIRSSILKFGYNKTRIWIRLFMSKVQYIVNWTEISVLAVILKKLFDVTVLEIVLKTIKQIVQHISFRVKKNGYKNSAERNAHFEEFPKKQHSEPKFKSSIENRDRTKCNLNKQTTSKASKTIDSLGCSRYFFNKRHYIHFSGEMTVEIFCSI